MKFFAQNGIDYLEINIDSEGNHLLSTSIGGIVTNITPLSSASNGLQVDPSNSSNVILGGTLTQPTNVTADATNTLNLHGYVKFSNLPASPGTPSLQALVLDTTSGALVQNTVTPSGAVGATSDLVGTYPAPTIGTKKVTTDKINDGAVGTTQIADNAVGTTKLAADAVTTAKIANAAVGTTQIATSAITTALINNGAVTGPKLDPATTVTSVNGQVGSVTVKEASRVPVTTTSTTVALTNADSGKLFSPAKAATGPVTYSLPAAPTEGVYFEFVGAYQNIVIDAGSTNHIRLDNMVTTGNANKFSTSGTNGYCIIAYLYTDTAPEWIILTFRGTWDLAGF